MKLTIYSKILLALIVLAAAASAATNLWRKSQGSQGPAAQEASASSAGNPNIRPASGRALGSKDNPLKVSLVSFHGYAPALLANGKSMTTQPGSIYDKNGVAIEFLLQDDIPTLSTLFSGVADCAWRTSDFWAQEQPNLRNANMDGKAVMIVDNTQGADAVIAKDASIRSIEDLAAKKVALLQFTPSHGMLIDALNNSSLTARRRASVDTVFINAASGTAGVRAAFEAGNVDAAVLWDPDLSLAIKRTPGAHVVYSTKTASNLIFDVMVCNSKVLNNPEGVEAVHGFVKGWLEAVEVAKKNPDEAVDALIKTEDQFALLAKQEGKPFIKSLFSSLVWTGLDDNARILGLAGGTNHYERVYHAFDQIYRDAGALANPKSPVINAADSFDYRFIKKMLADNQQAMSSASKPQYDFSNSGLASASNNIAEVTKPVNVNFQTGSAELSKKAQKLLDDQVAPFVENNGSSYFEVSGNTDSTGNYEANMALSQRRAMNVVDYLVKQWEFDAKRFRVVGNGPNKPLCQEDQGNQDGLSLEDCRALNRTTRVGVLGR